MRWEVNASNRPHFTGERSSTNCIGPFWTAAGKISPTGIRSPDRLARSECLYRLNYPRALWKKVRVSVSLLNFRDEIVAV
jgi:hypothetical protein